MTVMSYFVNIISKLSNALGYTILFVPGCHFRGNCNTCNKYSNEHFTKCDMRLLYSTILLTYNTKVITKIA